MADKTEADNTMFWAGRGFGRGVWDERISPVEFLMLLLLNEEPTHGYDVIQRLAEKFSGLWSPKAGTVYPALGRLEEKGLIKVKVEESGVHAKEAEAEYPPKKVYVLTDKGALTLKNIVGKMELEEKFIDRFRGVVDQSVWASFDNMALKRIEGHIERALTGAAHAVDDAMRVLSPQDSVHELEFYRDQLKTELDGIEKKLSELREKEKKFRKVEIQ
jgi:DNA-binding PadR family transcriptional regulator